MIPSSHAATMYAPIRGRVATSTGSGHLYDPDEQHERVTRDRKQSLNRWSEILIPVREEVGELIESG